MDKLEDGIKCHQTTERNKKASTQNELIPVPGSSVVPSLPVDKLNEKVGRSQQSNCQLKIILTLKTVKNP